jgi:hypothetical protein
VHLVKAGSSRRVIVAAFSTRDILCRIKFAYLANLHFESNPYPRRRNARLMDFYHCQVSSKTLMILGPFMYMAAFL